MTAKAVAAGARIDFGWGRHWLPPVRPPLGQSCRPLMRVRAPLFGRDAIVPSEWLHAYLACHEAKAEAEAKAAVMLGGDDQTATRCWPPPPPPPPPPPQPQPPQPPPPHLELEVHARAHHALTLHHASVPTALFHASLRFVSALRSSISTYRRKLS